MHLSEFLSDMSILGKHVQRTTRQWGGVVAWKLATH